MTDAANSDPPLIPSSVAARAVGVRKVYGEGDARSRRSTASRSTSSPVSSPR